MKHSKSSLFLMEFIVALFFFTMACAVCVQFYTKCFRISHLSVNQNHACIWASNLAELWYDSLEEAEDHYTDYLLDTLSASEKIPEDVIVYPGYVDAGSPVLCLYFDADWKLLKDPEVCAYPDARFLITLRTEVNGNTATSEISATMLDGTVSPLYELSLEKHLQARLGKGGDR